MGSSSTLLLLLCLCLASRASAAAHNVIRGAQPENIEKYQPVNGKFTCFDGSKTIDFNQVNDNFCDCADSSDEPGTSACPNGVFYCRNKGHESKLLATSFVDDGVCDCCDGTDELSGCRNTCIEKNSAKRDALRAKIDEYKASLQSKAQYAASAAGVRENIKQRHQNVDGDIAATEQELQKLAADKTRLEEETEVKRAEHKKQQAAAAAQRKAEREAAAAKAAEEAAAAAKAAEEQAAADEAGAEQAAAAAADGAAGEQAAAAAAADQEETDEERGRRIAAQWTNDPAAAGTASAATDEAADQQQAVTEEGGKDAAWSISGVLSKAKQSVQKIIGGTPSPDAAPEGDDAGADAAAAAGDEDEEPPLPYEEPLPEEGDSDEPDWSLNDAGVVADADYEPFDDSELKKVIEDHSAAERKLAELRVEKERVARQVNLTFNDAWAGLMNKCLEARMPQFMYKFCFFDKASQVDNGGGHETSLGFWKGFENGGTEAVFDGGDYCHKAPARSLRVRIECGTTERAWDASEPEVCSYAVHASTPAACKSDSLKELEDNMAALLAEEAALAAEIAAEEAQRQRDLAALREKIEGGGQRDEL
ncbi:glucosidase II beta subunit-like-domain-containing protein [Scenedesmus sp. NREL 46B-D3]|nr:glucosidase II beta subunit-like-domain-containing protein [Scenedesmus sp. NREL 46B-D3]